MAIMLIDQDTCIGCGQCILYCPLNAIALKTKVEEGKKRRYSEIDCDECVECSNCLLWSECPTDSIYQQELVWPRILRSSFSSPLTSHKETNISITYQNWVSQFHVGGIILIAMFI